MTDDRALRTADEQATLEDVYYAYRFILRRPADPAGLANYEKLVSGGLSFAELVRIFEESDEARERVADRLQPIPVDLGGYQVCVQKRDSDFAHSILATRDYEPHVRQAVRERIRPGDVVVDVGANVGCIALMASALVGEEGLVVAIEPNPDNLRLLYAGVMLNGSKNVRVFSCAASDRPAIASLTGGISNTHLVAARELGPETVYTQTVVLDEFLAWLPRLDLVKLDIEGHEPRAFAGFTTLIERYRPAIVVEFNPRCLIDLAQREPIAFLDQMFALYPRLRAISAFDDDASFERSSDLMDYWHLRNKEVTEAGLLPDRLLHFDLVGDRGRRNP